DAPGAAGPGATPATEVVGRADAGATGDDALKPRGRTLDVGAFLGLDVFGSDIELGNAWAPEQVPGTSLIIGGRGGVTLVPDLLPSSALDPQLGVEVELKLALASTSESVEGGRRAYFAPVFGWRAHGIARLRTHGRFHPHLVVGVGGESVVTSSPFMDDDTDASFYWGPGLTWRPNNKLVARADLRHGLTAGRDSNIVSTFELLIGIERSFDLGGHPVETVAPIPDSDGDGILDPVDQCDLEPETVNGFQDDDGCPDDPDSDGDGIADSKDECPHDAEDLDQFQDDDGCPEADNDADGIPDGADGCPNDPEDLDGWDDEDGCPDPDNDTDGILDGNDNCPNEPENFNGFEDGDGCLDDLPKVVKEYTGVIEGITFAYSSARIQPKSKAVLDRAALILQDYPDLRVLVEGHTDDRGVYDKNVALSLKRAEAVKWYLVDHGVAADRIETAGVGPDRPRASNKSKKGRDQNRRIEFHLIVGAQPAGAAATQPAGAPATQPAGAPATQPAGSGAAATQPSPPPTATTGTSKP
ncbi:MAG: OmpA family protein, partial [Myxococcales bacterium]|nr:OmpA family protein [Myxococcales bacterium]